MSFMVAFGLASIMLCIGIVIRGNVKFLKKMFMPTSVIAGVLGFIFMNTAFSKTAGAGIYTEFVTYLFTITFISIGLTSTKQSKNQKKGAENVSKKIAKGSLAMGLTWNILFALTPAVAAVILLMIGSYFGMSVIHGLLIPFAFAQGPGQAATFGSIMEQQYGIMNAATVGITFSVIGFLVCFLVGVPLIKLGIKKGLANRETKPTTSNYIERGYYTKEENRETLGHETFFSGNMDTMTFHFAIIGVCFMIALGLSQLVSSIPGIGPTFGGMLFIYGMLAGYFMKFILKKLNFDHLLDNTFQTKFTGWTTDYLIVASFMAVQLGVIGNWIVPILIVSIAIALVTAGVCIYFGKRIGGDNDFDRTIALFGTTTGTVPSGIALIRIIDPSLRNTTAIELGLMNLPMSASYVTVLTIFAMAAGTLSIPIGLMLLIAPIPAYLIVMKLTKVWGEKTYSFKVEENSILNQKKVVTETTISS